MVPPTYQPLLVGAVVAIVAIGTVATGAVEAAVESIDFADLFQLDSYSLDSSCLASSPAFQMA